MLQSVPQTTVPDAAELSRAQSPQTSPGCASGVDDQKTLNGITKGVAQIMVDVIDSILTPSSFTATVDKSALWTMIRLFVRLSQEQQVLPTAMKGLDGKVEIRLNDKKMEKIIDKGGQATIYEGRIKVDGFSEDVAVKVYHSIASNSSAKSLQTVYREIAIHRCISHPHICPLLGVIWKPSEDLESSPAPVLPRSTKVTEYLSSLNLPDRRKALSRIGIDLASALVYLHSYGIIHGDLHEGNVLIDSSGGVKLADFGLASFAGAKATDHVLQPRSGRPWLAPELHMKDGEGQTFASDMFSFGTVLHQLWDFHESCETEAKAPGMLNEKIRNVHVKKLAPKVPGPVRSVIEDCRKPTPHERPDANNVLLRLKTCTRRKGFRYYAFYVVPAAVALYLISTLLMY